MALRGSQRNKYISKGENEYLYFPSTQETEVAHLERQHKKERERARERERKGGVRLEKG